MRVAVIGVGRWGINHVRVCKHLKDEGLCDGIVACDKERSRAKLAQRLYGVDGVYADASEMFRSEQIDAAIVSVQTIYHRDVGLLALSHADVLLEKPIAGTLPEAEELLREAEREDRILAVGHVERFNPVILALKKYLADIGEGIRYVAAQRIGPGPIPTRTDNLGAAHDLLVHDVDIAMHAVGSKPAEVHASTVRTPDFPLECEIHGVFIFPNEARTTADLHASWRAGPTFKRRLLCLQTTRRFITVDYVSQHIRVEEGAIKHKTSEGYVGVLRAYEARGLTERRLLTGAEDEPLLLQDKHFLRCVAEHKRPLADGQAGYDALKCVVYALRSADKGMRLRIPWDR